MIATSQRWLLTCAWQPFSPRSDQAPAGPWTQSGGGAPMGPQNFSIDLKTISFAFPFSFSPSSPPFSFFLFYFLSHRLIRHRFSHCADEEAEHTELTCVKLFSHSRLWWCWTGRWWARKRWTMSLPLSPFIPQNRNSPSVDLWTSNCGFTLFHQMVTLRRKRWVYEFEDRKPWQGWMLISIYEMNFLLIPIFFSANEARWSCYCSEVFRRWILFGSRRFQPKD